MNLQETINQHLSSLPENLQAEILDFVLFLEHKRQQKPKLMSKEQRRLRISESLSWLAKHNTFADIQDPVAWQQELRRDRPLPGRE